MHASSKAAVSCFTEALAHQLVAVGTPVRAHVFYPSGGLLDTGLFTATRNRPAELQRVILDQIRADKYIISMTLDQVGELLHARADAIANGDLPPAFH